MNLWSRCAAAPCDARAMRRAHSVMAIIWGVLAIVTTAWAVYDPESKLLMGWLVFMSAYALSVGHWGARQGAGAEVSAGEKDG